MHNYILFVQQLAIEIKTSFSSLIYRKALKLTPSALSEISLGNIVTLITKDVHTFEQSIWMINEFWVSAIQTCVLCYLLYTRIGFVSFIGVGILISIMPVQCKYTVCSNINVIFKFAAISVICTKSALILLTAVTY